MYLFMSLFISIIDFFIILLLLRFLIRPTEVYTHPIYGLIYTITDFVLTPSKSLARTPAQGTLVTIIALVAIQGLLYMGIKPVSYVAGAGISLLSLLKFLFQAYMVIWFISILSSRDYRTFFLQMLDRAFLPFYSVTRRFGIPREMFYLSIFLSLWLIYSLLSISILSLMIVQTDFVPVTIIQGLADGLILILKLFPFPGFFSLMIFIGVFLSWVSPDPSNPVVQAIYGISEPLIAPFRRFVPLVGGLDFSPWIALICYNILGKIGVELITGIMK